MNTTAHNFLFQLNPPFITLAPPEESSDGWIESCYYQFPGLVTRVIKIRGRKCQVVPNLMSEFGAAFQFFDGFGENWPALNECLSYLDEWIPAQSYVTLITEAELVLAKENDEELRSFLRNLSAVAQFWMSPVADGERFDRESIPFHVLFLFSKGKEQCADRFANLAEKDAIPIRRIAL